VNNMPNTIKNLDEKELEKLFELYFTALCYFSKKITSDIDASKDIVHDVFINLWTKRDEIDLKKSVKSYLFTSVYNKSLNYLRDNKKFSKNVELSDLNIASDNTKYDELIDNSLLNNKINNAINKLPKKCRRVFYLSRFDNLKYNEIANKLNISVKTVEAQISKALKILKFELKDYVKLIILLLIMYKGK